MTTKLDLAPANDRELVLARLIDAPLDAVWRAWTDPEVLKRWFVPRPWTITEAVLDLRPGGHNHTTMADPEGNTYPNVGQYLEVVPRQKLVFTDAYVGDWKVSDKPFMTVTTTFEADGERTRLVSRVQHWTVADRESHEKMGFHDGWGQAAEQLEEVARTL